MRASGDDGTKPAAHTRLRSRALRLQAGVAPPRRQRTTSRRVRFATLALPFVLAACATDGPFRGGLLTLGAPRLKVGDELVAASALSGETCRVVKTYEAGTSARIEDFEVR